MKKIFVTGGSGFVGQNIIPILIDNGYEVEALARSNKSLKIVSKLGAKPIKDDLYDLSRSTKESLKQCDYVLHSAALMDFTYDPKPFYDLNVIATQKLLKLSREAKIEKFIYISAAPVVPGSPIINLTEEQAGKGLPKALYPKTKAIGEQEVLNANDKTFQTISYLLENVQNGKWRWIGGGNQILSTIHVKNLGNAILASFNSDIGGKAFFVTDGERRSMKSFFKGVLEAQGLNPGDKVLPLWIASIAANSIEKV